MGKPKLPTELLKPVGPIFMDNHSFMSKKKIMHFG